MTEAEFSLPMFTDELERQLDSGLRVPLPKDWRSPLLTEFFLITDSSNSFIKAFPVSEYRTYIGRIKSDTTLDPTLRNEHLEEIASSVKRVEIDSAGRIALPAKLCAEIGIEGKNTKVILKGADSTFNIWNPARLKEKQDRNRRRAEAGEAPLSAKKFLGV